MIDICRRFFFKIYSIEIHLKPPDTEVDAIASSLTSNVEAVPCGEKGPIQSGDKVLYRPKDGAVTDATVISVHNDDPEGPYYIIKFPGGNERQVTGQSLKPLGSSS